MPSSQDTYWTILHINFIRHVLDIYSINTSEDLDQLSPISFFNLPFLFRVWFKQTIMNPSFKFGVPVKFCWDTSILQPFSGCFSKVGVLPPNQAYYMKHKYFQASISSSKCNYPYLWLQSNTFILSSLAGVRMHWFCISRLVFQAFATLVLQGKNRSFFLKVSKMEIWPFLNNYSWNCKRKWKLEASMVFKYTSCRYSFTKYGAMVCPQNV